MKINLTLMDQMALTDTGMTFEKIRSSFQNEILVGVESDFFYKKTGATVLLK